MEEQASQPGYKQSTAWRRKAGATKRSESSMHDLRLRRMAAHQEWSCCLSLIGFLPRSSWATVNLQRFRTWRSCNRPESKRYSHEEPCVRLKRAFSFYQMVMLHSFVLRLKSRSNIDTAKEKRHTAEIYFMMMKIWKYQKLMFEQIDDCVLTSGLSKHHMGQMHSQLCW